MTLEEVQQANEVLRKSDNVDGSSTSAGGSTGTQSSLDRSSRISGTDWKNQDITDSSVSKDSASTLSDRDISSRLSGDVNLRRTNSSNDTDSIPSWRRSREESKKDVS